MSVMQEERYEAQQFNSRLTGIVSKIIQLLELEAKCLDTGNHSELGDFAKKKMNLFSELQILNNRFQNVRMSSLNEDGIRELKAQLLNNKRSLNLRVKAIRQLSSTIEQALKNEQSDGTYSIGAMAMRGYV